MAEPTMTSASATIAISALGGAIDTATLMAIASVAGVGITMPAVIGTFAGVQHGRARRHVACAGWCSLLNVRSWTSCAVSMSLACRQRDAER